MEEKKILKRWKNDRKIVPERWESALGKCKVKKIASKPKEIDTTKSNFEALKPQIGKYLQQATTSTNKVKAAKQSTQEDNNNDLIRPSRLPPPQIKIR